MNPDVLVSRDVRPGPVPAGALPGVSADSESPLERPRGANGKRRPFPPLPAGPERPERPQQPEPPADSRGRLTWKARLARRALFRVLARLPRGRITVVDALGRATFGEAAPHDPLQAEVRVHDPACYPALLLRGSTGAGEAYMRGQWDADDLTALVRILVANRPVLQRLDGGPGPLGMALDRLVHALRPNTRTGSRRNITAHYDLGNDFFAAFLDPTLMYSGAVFPHPGATLEEASRHKLERICEKLALGPADHVLEIGTGWGGFALHAARTRGCRVTTATVSPAQYAYAREQVRRAGLEDRVTVLLRDYRELEGRFDKLVSIEMVEAVGHAWLDTYFRTCQRLLAPGGMMLLQAITIADAYYDEARRSVDFIQRHIFPGGALPSVSALTGSIARTGPLRLFHLEDLGPHYAATLAHWQRRFQTNREAIAAMGFDEAFLRKWAFYFAYCEGGFRERAISLVQMLLVGPENRRAPIVPALA